MSDFVFKTAADGALIANGLNIVTGGAAGLAGLTLRAPYPGERCTIRLDSITSTKTAVVTGVDCTLDGTNNTATFDAADEALELVYDGAGKWAIALNIGGVALSTV
ncbi:MAG: hypothetical protein ACOYI5_10205 [Christensenellales bacterium]|jgi:hypothetical protein